MSALGTVRAIRAELQRNPSEGVDTPQPLDDLVRIGAR